LALQPPVQDWFPSDLLVSTSPGNSASLNLKKRSRPILILMGGMGMGKDQIKVKNGPPEGTFLNSEDSGFHFPYRVNIFPIR
jgi:hypothetical protein